MEVLYGSRMSVLGLLLFISSVSCRFVVQEQSLKVTSESLKGTFSSAIANFGIPQYGGSMSGILVYQGGEKAQGCARALQGTSLKTGTGELPKILLVDRGGCYFSEKVWNAQNAGASGVLVADDKEESLITMDSPEDDPATDKYINNITIPSALIRKNTSDAIKSALKKKELVSVNMDWTEALPHPDDRVEYEFWTNSNDECGAKCDAQAQFVSEFRGIAQTMEQSGYVKFTPHYITWYCPRTYLESKQCKSQCINNGRYCAPDPEQDFDIGYDGKDVVLENLRELCVYQQGKMLGKPWVWWDYVTDFKLRCRMKDNNYNRDCAEKIMTALGLDLRRIRDCVGDTNQDIENSVLKSEQGNQIGDDMRSDVTILPTLIINQKQYRGKLDAKAVLKAICSGFKETTDPPQCLGKDIETNECNQPSNGGCWKEGNYTACKDTFRGRVCQCPKDELTGTVFVGDGYTSCKPAGRGRCRVNNGGCWSSSKGGKYFTACSDDLSGTGCECPSGFTGDGFHCEDVDECKSPDICRCPGCKCTNSYGSFQCSCASGGVYIAGEDVCVGTTSDIANVATSKVGWTVGIVILTFLIVGALVGYVVYKYRIRSYMDSEIRAIMAQYMPLDSQNEALSKNQDEA